MNWISIGLAALSGALAAALASVLVRNPKEKRVYYAIVFIVCFAAFQALSRELISPHINAWNGARKAEAALLEIPAFQAIKQYDPSTYESLVADLREFIKKEAQSQVLGVRNDESRIVGAVKRRIAEIVQKRLPSASDEAVVSYMSVMVAEMGELHRHGGDLCYRFLFPQHSTPIDGRKYFSKQTQEADLAALAQVIRTSAEKPQAIPREADVMPSLEPIIVELVKEFGNDMDMLRNPAAPTTDKAKVCSITIDLYSRVLRLPQNESSRVLRFMLSQA